SAARQTITEPRPHCHRERSVAIYVPTLRFSVIASVAWRSNILQAHEFYETLGLLVKKSD
ncbi:MAG: hypothetical protein ACO30K_15735, partial [bacterium]